MLGECCASERDCFFVSFELVVFTLYICIRYVSVECDSYLDGKDFGCLIYANDFMLNSNRKIYNNKINESTIA